MLFFLLIRVFKSLSGSDPRLLYIVSEWVAAAGHARSFMLKAFLIN